MLAEKTSFTKSGLPKILQDKAIVLAGEPVWPASEAVLVVNWLEANRQEVAGVELWRDVQGEPLFVASSDYSPGVNDQVTPESISWCARKARVFIAKFGHMPDGLFNISTTEPLTKTNDAMPQSSLHIYSQVQLLTDRYQSEGASCFDLGYIVEVYPDNKYEVELFDLNGITTAQIVADENDLQLAPPTYAAPRPNPNAPRMNVDPVKEHNP